MKLSCGVVLLNERDELFVAHVTGSSYWDLPKGLADPGEAPRAAAVREAREEAGLRLRAEALADLGAFDYLPAKRLHLFAAKVARAALDPAGCRCTSFFFDRRTRQRRPETDGFAWIGFDEVARRCARRMAAVLTEQVGMVALAARLPLVEALDAGPGTLEAQSSASP